MQILKLTIQNFKSIGNKKIILDFENDFDNDLILMQAQIGSGKTATREALEFALYGKVEGFKLSDLANRTNKALCVSVKLLSKMKVIEIERCMNPSLFKLTINTKVYDQAGKRDVQEYIETELFDIPYHVFKNIIVLSILGISAPVSAADDLKVLYVGNPQAGVQYTCCVN